MQSLLNLRKIGVAFAAAIALLMIGLIPGTANAHPGSSEKHESSQTREVQKLIKTLKKVTAEFTDVEEAVEAGYRPDSGCVEVPGVGAMGIHYVNHKLVDGVINPKAPEVLVYMPDDEGELKLGAVEFLTVGLSEPPVIAGITFDTGPFAGNHSLHAWIYVENPKGTFVNYNPAISCP